MFLCAPITHAVGADEDVDFTKTQWALPLCYVTGPWRLVPAHAVVGTVPLLPVLTDFHRLRRLKPAVPSDFRLQPEGAGHATAMQAACLAVEPVFAVTPVVLAHRNVIFVNELSYITPKLRRLRAATTQTHAQPTSHPTHPPYRQLHPLPTATSFSMLTCPPLAAVWGAAMRASATRRRSTVAHGAAPPL